MRLLVVEDEQKVANALREGLEGEGDEVVVERNGEDALERMTHDTFDVILLDLTLPGRDGLQVLSTCRERGVETPVVVLTARDTLEDRVIGLDMGADDYLVKPFAFAELLARIRAVERRGRVTETGLLGVDNLEIDRATRQVTRAGVPVELTAKEYDLLNYLARQARQVVSRDTLVREVWRETRLVDHGPRPGAVGGYGTHHVADARGLAAVAALARRRGERISPAGVEIRSCIRASAGTRGGSEPHAAAGAPSPHSEVAGRSWWTL